MSDFKFWLLNDTLNENRFYDVEYEGKEMRISISYENIENHLEIIVFKFDNSGFFKTTYGRV